MTKRVTVTYEARFSEEIEVPDDWEYNGDLDSILEFTDMPFGNGDLTDWRVE